jgi:hypothetical protein
MKYLIEANTIYKCRAIRLKEFEKLGASFGLFWPAGQVRL